MSPCMSHINKVYQFVGPTEGPMETLVTNLNFYAADACIGITHSFITTGHLSKVDSPSACNESYYA